ncbi:conserved hypothetical protein, similar to cyclopropyl sterol isomerase [gamma proteobacterium HdN1]|nr:conserved hypothetical protein, similar to cyclopropyl sterol isomerase [gamma proteobacterium HdN1]
MSETRAHYAVKVSHSLEDAPKMAHWFSQNPDRAWAERFFLAYSPIWMALMAVMMFTGWTETFSNDALLGHAVIVAAPLLAVPAILRRGHNPSGHWWESYWFKANLYIGIFGFFGNYFGSEYFFDVLGMVYHFPNATTTLDASLVGQGDQTVPLIMYFYTHAYFMTYHTTAVLVLRRIFSAGFPSLTVVFFPVVFVVGYAWAWIETRAMANPLIAANFHYTRMDAMLAYGSAIYALYFIASFPIFYHLDEVAEKRWDLLKVSAAGLSASMLTFYLLDFTAAIVGRL